MILNPKGTDVGEGLVEPFIDIGGREVRCIADAHDTPTFIYDDDYFGMSVASLKTMWDETFGDSKMYLSYKTNYMTALCRTAHAKGVGADVVSGYELEHALRMCPGGPIVFNGPLKRPEEIMRAVNADVTINVDLLEELRILANLRKGKKISEPRLGLRVNPGKAVFRSPDPSFVEVHETRQKTAKFGWPIEGGKAAEAAEEVRRHGFDISAVHAHLNSQITDVDLHIEALLPVLDFARSLRNAGAPVSEINIGGGFGVPGMRRQRRGWWSELRQKMGEVPREESHSVFDMAKFLRALHAVVRERALDDLTISCEPGRYLMSDCMALLTRVVGVKQLRGRTWVILDGGLNILPTAAFGERRRLRFFRKDEEIWPTEGDPLVSLGGPLCYEGDVVMSQVRVPASIAAGDLVLVSDAGAYTVSRSTNFNQPRAAVVSRNGDSGLEVWRREDYNDIFSFESRI